jgi:hypothetical protein
MTLTTFIGFIWISLFLSHRLRSVLLPEDLTSLFGVIGSSKSGVLAQIHGFEIRSA